MTSTNPPAKHHYIPRFLLGQWAVDDGKLWRFVQPIPGKIAAKHVAPAEIGYEKHLYATPGLPPDKTQKVEQHFMSPLDDLAAESHQLILAGKLGALTQKQRSAWSRFIMSQWFRTPAGLGHFKEAMGLVLKARDDALDVRYQEVRQDGYPGSLEDVIAMMGPDFAGQAAMDLFQKMIDDPKNGLRLNNMPCLVIETSESNEFLISDAALQQSKAGIFSPKGYMTLPIAPRKLFSWPRPKPASSDPLEPCRRATSLRAAIAPWCDGHRSSSAQPIGRRRPSFQPTSALKTTRR